MDMDFLRRAVAMRHWTFWEWVAYVALFVAAFIVVADTGFRGAPDVMTRLPEFFHSWWWGFAPAVLVIVATIILLLREFVFKPRNHKTPFPMAARDGFEPSEPVHVAAIQHSIKRGLYVGQILASFNKLREDYVIELGILAYNGTGEAISLLGITGAITFDMQDTHEPLPQQYSWIEVREQRAYQVSPKCCSFWKSECPAS
jgi:hypothetical protein